MDRPVYGGSSRSHTETDRLRLDYISPAYQSFFVSDDISVPVPGSEQIRVSLLFHGQGLVKIIRKIDMHMKNCHFAFEAASL